MVDTTPVLVADSVSKSFAEKRVLKSATLRGMPGQVRALFGRNGCGKSTLLKIAAGLIQPDSGTVHFAGRARLAARFPTLARDGLFFLPDHDLFSTAFSLRRQLESIRRRYTGENVAAIATIAGVEAHLDRRPHQVSGGELRRSEVAAALIRRPLCFIADEPFRGVAPRDAETLGDLFRRLAANGCAVIVTGHEVNVLFDACDHVTWCTAGTTYELGTPSQARENERFAMEYLGSAPGAPSRSIS